MTDRRNQTICHIKIDRYILSNVVYLCAQILRTLNMQSIVINMNLNPTHDQMSKLSNLANGISFVYLRTASKMFKQRRKNKDVGFCSDYTDEFTSSLWSEHESLREFDIRSYIAKIKEAYHRISNMSNINKNSRLHLKPIGSKVSIKVYDVIPQRHTVMIPHIGTVKCRNIGNRLRTGIKYPATLIVIPNKNQYKIVFQITTQDIQHFACTTDDKVIGIDYGLRKLGTLSTGEKLELPKSIFKLQKEMSFYLSRRDSSIKGSNHYKTWNDKYNKCSIRLQNTLNAYCKDIADKLTQQYDLIVGEPIEFQSKLFRWRNFNRCIELGTISHINNTGKHIKRKKNVMYHAHNRNVMFTGLSQLYKWIESFCIKRGKKFMFTNKTFPSTQLCSTCGYKYIMIKNDVNIRDWTCPMCGTHHDRDVNAAINIREFGLKYLRVKNQLFTGHNSCIGESNVNENVSVSSFSDTTLAHLHINSKITENDQLVNSVEQSVQSSEIFSTNLDVVASSDINANVGFASVSDTCTTIAESVEDTSNQNVAVLESTHTDTHNVYGSNISDLEQRFLNVVIPELTGNRPLIFGCNGRLNDLYLPPDLMRQIATAGSKTTAMSKFGKR